MDESTETQRQRLRSLLLEKSVCRGEFTLVSGKVSDFYVDSKLTTFDPEGLTLIGQLGWAMISHRVTGMSEAPRFIGGLTMGADAIAFAIMLESYRQNSQAPLQSLAVRKEPKAHGRHKLIEGNFEPGQSVIVIDDVITTGGSTLRAIDAIEEAGGHVAFVLVLVDREEGGRENIEERGFEVLSFFTRTDL